MSAKIGINYVTGNVHYQDESEYPSAVRPDDCLVAIWPIAMFTLMFPDFPQSPTLISATYDLDLGQYHVSCVENGSAVVHGYNSPSEHPILNWMDTNRAAIRLEALTYRMNELEPA